MVPWGLALDFQTSNCVVVPLGSPLLGKSPGLPRRSMVVPCGGSHLDSYKVIPKRNYCGACGYLVHWQDMSVVTPAPMPRSETARKFGMQKSSLSCLAVSDLLEFRVHRLFGTWDKGLGLRI